MKDPLKLLSIFLAIFLLFNSGFIYEVAKDNPSTISFNKNIDFPKFNDQEVHATKWLVNITDSYPIYADYYGLLLLKGFAVWRVRPFFAETNELPSGAYIYLRSLNLNGSMIEYHKKTGYLYVEFLNSTFYNDLITKKNMIFDNGGSKIYH